MRMLYVETPLYVFLQSLECQKSPNILSSRKGLDIELKIIFDTQIQCLITLLLFSNAVRIHLNMEM